MNEREEKQKNQDTKPLNPASTASNDEPLLFKNESQAETPSALLFIKRRNVIIALALITLLLVAVLIYLFRNRQAGPTEEENIVVSVKTARAEKQPLAQEVSAIGTIFPREQATVSSNIGAQIKKMSLLKNAVVRQGQIIATLDSRDLQAQRAETAAALQEARLNLRSLTTGSIPQGDAQAEKDLRDARANVENARATYERRKDLYAKGGISLKEVEAAKLALTTAEDSLRLAERTVSLRAKAINPNDRALAESRVRQAEDRLASIDTQLSFTNIRAPITGIVTDQFQFEGEYVASGARIVNIADISEIIVKAQFSDTVVANLKVGDAATVLPTDLPGERMGGKVTLISRSTDPQNRTVEIWVTLGNGAGRLRAGGAAQVTVSANQTEDAVTVPASAVTLDASNSNEGTVMVVGADGLAHETKVAIGIRTKDNVQITEGLQGGEEVIVEGNYALPDGTKVEVKNDEPGKGDGREEKKGEKP